ncbi:hypothetical protein LOTGIDRAFT_133518 [Lottia gigantea]|uniref:Alpha-ketoglutarate-dependent dioxygenase alkB homolog 3 n=1 Tax=Lottia gigantea TaxID=225164 RepID=V3YZ25_LOTGI|nr:hypothetical protein LOTGIDRAFT_133518 [Lottia gigantea]ESO83383.1 hypothetical protein LOTGIDRAFT_133518 [Lottia gigantea]
MNTKQKRSRVQGGWAAPKKQTARSDKDRVKPPNVPVWTSKNIDQVSATPQFLYQQPDEEIEYQPAPRQNCKGGVYDISDGPSGISRLRFFPNFINQSDANKYYDMLYQGLPWKQNSYVKNGVTHLNDRLTAWVGDLPYSYSGIVHPADPSWIPPLPTLKDKIEDLTGYKFNSLLGNLYRDDKDGVEWHCDDEPELGPQPIIASVSLGDVRNFELRQKPVPNTGDYTFSQIVRMPLTHGSLLIMEGGTQDDWQHRIPKEYHDRGPRINLTFRVIYPKP